MASLDVLIPQQDTLLRFIPVMSESSCKIGPYTNSLCILIRIEASMCFKTHFLSDRALNVVALGPHHGLKHARCLVLPLAASLEISS